MREIKFRAYPLKHVEEFPSSKDIMPMYYLEFPFKIDGIYWFDKFEGKDRKVRSIVSQEQLDKLTIMQYTGLEDKNGEEIFEGDIVSIESFEPKIHEIKFIEGGFCYWRDDVGMPTDINLPNYDEEVEVIGNIYQNPELLK